MIIKQVSIFLENRSGQLLEITDLLAKNNVDLWAMNIAETSDYGIVRIVPDDVTKAQETLKENGYIFSVNDVVAAEVPNTPGGLHNLLADVTKDNINVEYMYSIFSEKSGSAWMVIKVNEPHKLLEIIEKTRKADVVDLKQK